MVVHHDTISMMLPLPRERIVDLFVWVDDHLPKQLPHRSGGRMSLLTDSEIVTLLVWNAITLHQQTLKDVHAFVGVYLRSEFPVLPSYSAFVAHGHRVLPHLLHLLTEILQTDAPLRFLDSTMLPVCTRRRADAYRVAAGIAQFGKNHQGWHFGFKLHASVNPEGQLCRLFFTPANAFDGTYADRLIDRRTRVGVGDGSYGGAGLRQKLWERFGTFLLAPPHYAHRTNVIAPWQTLLLSMRSKIESVFDVLKQHLHLVTSFPRSVQGYFVHYIRILLGYQILSLWSGK